MIVVVVGAVGSFDVARSVRVTAVLFILLEVVYAIVFVDVVVVVSSYVNLAVGRSVGM